MPDFSNLCFSPEPEQRSIARRLYETVRSLPLVCPHGHVDPRLFSDPEYRFGSPAELFLIPDHYIFRMLYSQGIPLENLGVPRVDGGPTETDHRKIWQIFCENFPLFRGTPTGIWLREELRDVFGIAETPNAGNASSLYDRIAAQLETAEFRPRALYARFDIEVLCTTDAATDDLHYHQTIRDSGWAGRILPTFRPDGVINLDAPNWRANIDLLSEQSGIEVTDYASLIAALENRRQFFKAMGATATDHAALTADTAPLSENEAEAIFVHALGGKATTEDTRRFTAHMLGEMARMSVEDGLVMQLHVGSLRNHNPAVFGRFGLDKGADIPVSTEYTRALKPLLDRFGNDPRFTLVLFTLDETNYARELAPLAGHYPCLRLGPPWWFHDSPNGMVRFLDGVLETAGVYNLAGFNDDTRAFCSIPARHDVWRRVCCNYLAGWVREERITESEAAEMAGELAYYLARKTYRLKLRFG
ncbi:MAG: glucuronate isomerase [Armatimonadaceae bacterium]